MKRICKKLLIFLFIFTTFIGGAFASSRPAPYMEKEYSLLQKVIGNIRTLEINYNTGRNIEKQNTARGFINKVLSNKKFSSYVSFAFDDVMSEDVKIYENAVNEGNKVKMENTKQYINNLKNLREEFGL